MAKHFSSYIAVLLLSVLASGCATIAGDSLSQPVWVQTDPPGADIKVGGRVVGQTPFYVAVPRQQSPRLYLSRDGVEKSVDLQTRYRWQASFFSNLVFYVFAPVGWAVDLISGRAWNPQDPGVINIRKKNDTKDYFLPDPDVVAIAPPLADSLMLSNAALGIMQRAVDAKRKQMSRPYSVLPYDSTLPLFLKNGTDFDGEGSHDEQRRLFHRLDADGYWKSKLTSTDEGMRIDAELIDKRTQSKLDELHIDADVPSSLSRTYEQGRRLFGLPNAVTVTLANQNFDFNRGTYQPVSIGAVEDNLWWEKGLSYLSTISITNIPAYRPGRSGRWQFSLYPTVRISHRNLVAKGAPDVAGQTFGRWLIAAGYGPELGYQFQRSYIYFNFFLNAAWSQIDWRYNYRDSSYAKTSLLGSSELGYLYSFSEYFSARIFVASNGEDPETWKQALIRTSNSSFPYSGQNDGVANMLTTGFSIGFSFEPYLVKDLRERQSSRK